MDRGTFCSLEELKDKLVVESKHVQDLETQVETAHATNKLLEEQLSAAQTALAQSQILARQQDELIQTLELKTKEQDKASMRHYSAKAKTWRVSRAQTQHCKQKFTN
ncbi:unnamed protein product [Aphanomyces euteiches]